MAIPRVLCRVRLLINNDFSVISKYPALANSVSINKCARFQLTRQFRTNFNTGLVLHSENKKQTEKDDRRSGLSSTSSSSSDSDSTDRDSDEEEALQLARSERTFARTLNRLSSKTGSTDSEVTIEYHRGLPQITVPLPSRRERCRFTLKPISNTVGDFLEMMKREDKGIDRVLCKTCDGTRIASSTTIETLLQENFRLLVNDTYYDVVPPTNERMSTEEVQKLSDIKNLVSQLYEAMHIKEHQLHKELELHTQLETLQQELQPMEQQKLDLEMVAYRKSNWMAWAGLGLMSVQFGILARLTWWEYSWDIMEPVTYFVTYGTAMACYAYFVLTREEYILNDVRDRQHLILLHKRAKKSGFDLHQYNTIKDQIVKLERDLKRLKDPLKLRVPPRTTTPAAGLQQEQPVATDEAAAATADSTTTTACREGAADAAKEKTDITAKVKTKE